jgi:UDP-N-acetylmuramoylalanine--D-glutamate ligase
MELKGKKITVIGMGITGIETANFLALKGAEVDLIDSRLREAFSELSLPTNPKIKTTFGSSTPSQNTEMVVLSPGVDIESSQLQEIKKQGTPILGEIELASRFNRIPIIAVTGTNGKTTTVTLTGIILENSGIVARTGGNIGTPFISQIEIDSPNYRVLEISSFQLETTDQFRAHIACVLNVTPDHLNRHKTIEEYARFKERIANNQTKDDFLILNADDPYTADMSKGKTSNILWFSLNQEVQQGAWIHNEKIMFRIGDQEGEVCNLKDLNPSLRLQAENAMAAFLLSYLAGANLSTIQKTFSEFSGLEHRLEKVATIEGIDFINDSKGTNIGSMHKAINSFSKPIVLIMGGQDKGGDFSTLKTLLKNKVKNLILIGEAKEKIKQSLNGTPPKEDSDSLKHAVQKAMQHAVPGDVVLFSPGCASFDMFKNYEDRGNQFKKLVGDLK